MKKLIVLLVLFPWSHLAAQGDDRSMWGPGEIGECVDPDSVTISLQTYYHSFVGRSLYLMEFGSPIRRGGPRPIECLRKIVDLPFQARAAEHDWSLSGDGIRIWSDEGEYRYVTDLNLLESVDGCGILGPFLQYPVVSAASSAGRYECFGGSTRKVNHTAQPVESAIPSLRDEVRPESTRIAAGRESEIHGVDVGDLAWALRSVNLEPWRLPVLAEFDFGEGDLLAYQERVKADAAELDSIGEVRFFRYDYPFAPTTDRRDLFLALPDMIDTVGIDIVAAALLAGKNRSRSTTSRMYEVVLVNEIGDSLFCSFEKSGADQPFNLPWTIRYGESEFHTFNVELARCLLPLLPEEASRSERVDKVKLLYAVGWYLGELRKREESGNQPPGQ